MSSIYLHIPFCKRRCFYCDFITYAGKEYLTDRYIQAMLLELEITAERLEDKYKQIDTVYFGGGTPSLLKADDVKKLLEQVAKCFYLSPEAEISLEANPGTISKETFKSYLNAGVNRLSLGVQSFSDMELQSLGRIHSKKECVEAIETAKNSGFTNLSLDLMFGVPSQTPDGWQQNLETALSLEPTHLSLYSLILEEGTPLFDAVQKGLVNIADDEETADMFENARYMLHAAGWQHYEISNWALHREYQSKHNKTYWLNGDWLGIGAAAHSHIGSCRFSNLESPEAYIHALAYPAQHNPSATLSPAQVWVKENDQLTEMRETMMLGFRLVEEGINLKLFRERYAEDAEKRFAKEIAYLKRRGLIEKINGGLGPRLRLREEAVAVANQVFEEFV
ncbi:MAG: radical SAM family heme chaperone HemW [Anaerolineaceae bacterium]|nr:radical SAM family heme chaperone HemW [Anaerolineaceae bacterium]